MRLVSPAIIAMNAPLTPPASRSRKENVNPSPSSSCASRPCLAPFRPAPRRAVLFSTNKNSLFPHTPPGPPRRLPSSAHISIPTRSILKRPSLLLPAASIQSGNSSDYTSMDRKHQPNGFRDTPLLNPSPTRCDIRRCLCLLSCPHRVS
jgi:hypothetical protein